jgi:hypothetical protein
VPVKSLSVGFSHACGVGFPVLAALIMSVGPSWAGFPVPTPLIGVTGPYGLLAAGAAYGGYLLFKRLKNRL